jgi:hypothetical protein
MDLQAAEAPEPKPPRNRSKERPRRVYRRGKWVGNGAPFAGMLTPKMQMLVVSLAAGKVKHQLRGGIITADDHFYGRSIVAAVRRRRMIEPKAIVLTEPGRMLAAALLALEAEILTANQPREG